MSSALLGRFNLYPKLKRATAAPDKPGVLGAFEKMGFSAGRGINGFRATSGDTAGGGFYVRVPLGSDERVIKAVLCGYSRIRLTASHGYLTLTDKRLIFTGSRRWMEPFAENRLILRYEDIDSCRFARRLNLGMFIGSLDQALIIRTKERIEHVLWPVADLTELQDRIDELRNGA